jgi:predicted TIM-barrel fold metal-dependent hydrolase
VIGGHIGVPWTDEVMSLATKYPNFYIDTSAYSTKRYPADIVAFLKGHGRGKVMFGTNHPAWPADMCLTHVDSLELDETTSQAFFHDNAVKAFKLDL